MRILFDRNVEPRYIHALDREQWTHTRRSDDRFSQQTADHRLAGHAEKHSLVIFTRDSDFFELVRDNYDCGLLFFHQKHATRPSTIVAAVDSIRDHYSEFTQIEEALPGGWV